MGNKRRRVTQATLGACGGTNLKVKASLNYVVCLVTKGNISIKICVLGLTDSLTFHNNIIIDAVVNTAQYMGGIVSRYIDRQKKCTLYAIKNFLWLSKSVHISTK